MKEYGGGAGIDTDTGVKMAAAARAAEQTRTQGAQKEAFSTRGRLNHVSLMDVAEGAAEQIEMATIERNEQGPTYYIPCSQAFVRRLAQLSPSADAKLRREAPAAFKGQPVQFASGSELFSTDGRSIGYLWMGENNTGLHLDSSYVWDIVPSSRGFGQTLRARRRE